MVRFTESRKHGIVKITSVVISRVIWPQTLINYFHSGALKKQEKSGALQPRSRILGCVWTKLNIIITVLNWLVLDGYSHAGVTLQHHSLKALLFGS